MKYKKSNSRTRYANSIKKRSMKYTYNTKTGDCNGTKVKIVAGYSRNKQYLIKVYKKTWLGTWSLCTKQKGFSAYQCFTNMSACKYYKAYCC